MKRIIFIVVGAIFTVLAVLVVFLKLVVFEEIDRQGSLNLAQNNINSQIAKAVGENEVKNYSNLLEFIKYPEVDLYNFSHDKNFDHDLRSIHFQTEDSFDEVLTFYQGKFPQKTPLMETPSISPVSGEPIEPFRTARFGVQVKPGTIVGRDWDSSLSIAITENKQDKKTSVALTSL